MQQNFNESGSPFLPEKPQARIPYSFWIFMANVGCILLMIVLSTAAVSLNWPRQYATLVVTPEFLCVWLLSSGIYAGFTYKSQEPKRARLNKIGLWGCTVIGILAFLLLILLGPISTFIR